MGDKVNELVEPLPIYRIWTQNDERDEINVSRIDQDIAKSFRGPIKIQLGEDDILYTSQDGALYSITQVSDD